MIGYPEKVPEESPRKKRRIGDNTTTRVPSDATPYLLGSALVIRYNKIEGSHFASDAKNFQDIAEALVKLHAQGLVHGDIRGLNMVFPEGENGASRFIDFDFTGVAEVDRHPLVGMLSSCPMFSEVGGDKRVGIWSRSTTGRTSLVSCHSTEVTVFSGKN